MRLVGVFANARTDLGRVGKGVDTKELDIKLILWFKPSPAIKTTIQM